MEEKKSTIKLSSYYYKTSKWEGWLGKITLPGKNSYTHEKREQPIITEQKQSQ